jgi:hypothetical protein
MYSNLTSLKAFLFTHGSTTMKNQTRVTRTIRNDRCLVWITHNNTPNQTCTYVDNLLKIHPKLTFGNLCMLGRCKYEHGDARKEYSVIFELKR